MIPYGGKELAASFRTVRKNTIQVAEDLPEDKYDYSPAADCRTVGRMLTHVAITPRVWLDLFGKRRVTTMVGFNFLEMMDEFHREEAKPRTKAQVLDLLRAEGETYAAWLDTLTPEFLSEMVTMGDGTQQSRFERLLGTKEHEMHHRAQLMLIERQLGIVPHITRQFSERIAQMRAAQASAGGQAASA